MSTPYASASLYVGDLGSDVTEGLLFEIFNCVGPVASIRVCRDAITRRSLGYAYVNFHNVVDAERALDTMNNTNIKGRPCRIMWSQRDPSLRKSGVGNIFIKNLDKGIDHKALYDTFSAFGNILSCKVVTDENNVSKGYGFVHYETQESADKAIAKVNGMMLNAKKVFVGPFKPRKERQASGDGEIKFTNVYIKDLSPTTSNQQLKDSFGQFGPITNAVVMTNEGQSKGFGFVNFENPTDAKKAVDTMNGQVIDGKKIYCGRAQKKAERDAELRQKFEMMKMERLNKYQGVNLYIKNLDDTINDERLRAEFAPFGNITSCKVMEDKGSSKGFGFVCYDSPESATRALQEMNTRMLGNKPLYVALAQRKDVRKAQLEAQYAAQRTKPVGPVVGGVVGGGVMVRSVVPGGQVFYGQGNMAPGFVYPPQQMVRSRWPGPQSHYQNMQGGFGLPGGGIQPGAAGAGGPRYPAQGPNRRQGNQPNSGKGRRGASNSVRGGRPAHDQQMQQPAQPAPAPAAGTEGAAQPQDAAPQYTPEQQMLGEKLFHFIAKIHPEYAPKITGMILDSCTVPELFDLSENEAKLNQKIAEAADVLKEHIQTQGEGTV